MRGTAWALVALVIVACSAPKSSIDEIVYVLADYVPEGWAVSCATERLDGGEIEPGRGVEMWSDYTLSWRPGVEEGSSRDESCSIPEGPSLFVNVGSRYYEDVYFAAFGLTPGEGASRGYDEDTPITRDGTVLELSFRVGCCIVKVGGVGVSEEELRALAAGLYPTDQTNWRNEVDDRLLIDDSRDSIE